jgi:pantetheine-phosphate adenylyltransferase
VSRFRHAVLGGTFDRFHIGHAALLERAFRVGMRVSIGVTSAKYLATHPKPDDRFLQSFPVRRAAVARWVARHAPGRARIVPLENPFGRSLEPGIDVLVVSAETLRGGLAVNRERRRLGRDSLPIEVVPVVLADDLRPVSSRRIRAGEIDRHGRRIGRIEVGLAAATPRDALVASAAIRRAFPGAHVRRVPAPSPKLSGRESLSRWSARTVAAAELGVAVRPRSPDGWWVVERTRATALRPRLIPGGGPAALRRGLLEMLRPLRSARRR